MRLLKFGGKSLATTEKIEALAKKVAQLDEHNLIVVVSAMGQSTSDLISLSEKLSPQKNSQQSTRELDMLLASGERVSAALFSLALQKYGRQSQSFTGSQAGVLTRGPHNDAEIQSLKPLRIDEALKQNTVPVIAGFQGVDPETKDITTLGRGGTDLTAVAFADHYGLKAELYKGVGGVFTCDPQLEPKAQLFSEISMDMIEEASFWGAKILHKKASSYAKKNKTPLSFFSDHSFTEQTKVNFSHQSTESFLIGSLEDILALEAPNQSIPKALQALHEAFKSVPYSILASAEDHGSSRLLFSTEKTFKKAFLDHPQFKTLSHDLCCVSLITELASQKTKALKTSQNFEVKRFLETERRLSFFIKNTQTQAFVSKLHQNLL